MHQCDPSMSDSRPQEHQCDPSTSAFVLELSAFSLSTSPAISFAANNCSVARYISAPSAVNRSLSAINGSTTAINGSTTAINGSTATINGSIVAINSSLCEGGEETCGVEVGSEGCA
eukprot:3110134-Rhodomonas_salina.1